MLLGSCFMLVKNVCCVKCDYCTLLFILTWILICLVIIRRMCICNKKNIFDVPFVYSLCWCMFFSVSSTSCYMSIQGPTVWLTGGLPGSTQCVWSCCSDARWGLVLWWGRSCEERQRWCGGASSRRTCLWRRYVLKPWYQVYL